jgi:hypothetical protein
MKRGRFLEQASPCDSGSSFKGGLKSTSELTGCLTNGQSRWRIKIKSFVAANQQSTYDRVNLVLTGQGKNNHYFLLTMN